MQGFLSPGGPLQQSWSARASYRVPQVLKSWMVADDSMEDTHLQQ
jgi:hypothetical protein